MSIRSSSTPLRRAIVRAVLSVASLTLGTTASAQSLTVTHTYPRCSSFTLASAPAGVHSTHSTPALVFAGTGGQLSVVDVTFQNHVLWSGAEPDIYVGGVVRDVALVRDPSDTSGLRDYAYVAADGGGLMSVKVGVSSGANLYEGELSGVDYKYAWAVAAIDVPNGSAKKRIVFVGTNDRDTGLGKIITIEHVTGGSPQFNTMNTYTASNTLKSVYSLVVSNDLTSGNHVTLLAAAGDSATDCGGVIRFDIPESAFLSSFTLGTHRTASWPTSSTVARLARDIVVNETEQVAFVAMHGYGISRFDVGGSGNLSESGGSWPTVVSPGHTQPRYNGVALSPDGNFLIAALGTTFGDEQQQWGTCSQPLSCDDFPNTPGPADNCHGVRVWELDSTSAYADGYSEVTTKTSLSGGADLWPTAVSTRPGSSGKFFIDVAAHADGLVTLELNPGATPPRFSSWEGQFGVFDGMLQGFDDVLVDPSSSDTLYATFERGIVAIDISNGGLPAPGTSNVGHGAAVLISPMPSGYEDFLVAGTDEGVYLFDISNPMQPFQLEGVFNSNGHGHIFVQGILAPAGAPEPEMPWIYVVTKDDSERATQTEGPVVRVFDANDACNQGDASECVDDVLATYVDEESFTSGTIVNRTFGGMVVRDTGNGSDQAVYVEYGPEFTIFDPANPTTPVAVGADKIGLVVLKLHCDSITGLTLTREPQGGTALDVEAVSASDRQPLGRLTFDTASSELYGAYGCYGVAKYSASSTWNPTFVGHRPAPAGSSAIHAVRIGSYVYTTYLGKNVITREPASTFGSTSVTPVEYKTRGQPVGLTAAPDTSGDFYLADGFGGVHRIVIQ